MEEERFVFISGATEQVSVGFGRGENGCENEGLTRSTREFHLARKHEQKQP